jgi:hypothetical protein
LILANIISLGYDIAAARAWGGGEGMKKAIPILFGLACITFLSIDPRLPPGPGTLPVPGPAPEKISPAPAPPSTAPGKALAAEPRYCASRNSKVFHLCTCDQVKRIKIENLEKFKTREEAGDRGRRPCKICKP